jgi:hypothetical protein
MVEALVYEVHLVRLKQAAIFHARSIQNKRLRKKKKENSRISASCQNVKATL